MQIKEPYIFNVAMTNANEEYSQALPEHTKEVLIKTRDGNDVLKLAYIEEQSGVSFITIPAGSTKSLSGAFLGNKTLYFQSPTAGEICEIEVWV